MDSVARLNDLRQRVLNGEEVTPEEYEEVIASIREARRAGAPTKASKPKRKTLADKGQELLDSLFDTIVEE